MTLLAPHRRSLRIPDFDYSDPNHVFFVTVKARRGGGKGPFSDPDLCKTIVQSLHHLRDSKGVRIYCYCLMPDHLHVLLSPSERSGGLVDVVHSFKSYTTRASWSLGRLGTLWSRSFYDRVIRDEEDFQTTCQYILGNPVRAGLVEHPDDYPYAALADFLPS